MSTGVVTVTVGPVHAATSVLACNSDGNGDGTNGGSLSKDPVVRITAEDPVCCSVRLNDKFGKAVLDPLISVLKQLAFDATLYNADKQSWLDQVKLSGDAMLQDAEDNPTDYAACLDQAASDQDASGAQGNVKAVRFYAGSYAEGADAEARLGKVMN